MPERYRTYETPTLEEQQKQIDDMEHRLKEYREEVARAAVQLKNASEATVNHDYSEVFAKQATSTRVSKWIWQIVTILMFIIMLLLSIALIVDIAEQGLTSSAVGTDLIVFSVFLIMSLFTLRQSNKARQDERETREMIMKLSTGEDSEADDVQW